VAEPLQLFFEWFAQAPPLELAQEYVKTFDLHKRTGLYVTFYSHGDRRERGLMLLRLKKLYRAAGLPPDDAELPDYLPLMLEFAAAAPDGRGEVVLGEHRAALELLHQSLAQRGSPYERVVDAVRLTLGEPSPADRVRAASLAAGEPPTELVGLEPFVPPEVMPAAEARR
jgi:nitrate reductase molybdenum cofactor assembly chaperone NarJ/NarW